MTISLMVVVAVSMMFSVITTQSTQFFQVKKAYAQVVAPFPIRYCYTHIFNGIPNQVSCGGANTLQSCLEEKAREIEFNNVIPTSDCEPWVASSSGSPIMTLASYNELYGTNYVPPGSGGTSNTDSDGDGVPDTSDQCPGVDDRIDVDRDGIPDCKDTLIDSDRDNVADNTDNCAATYNPDQKDTDRDHIGDACDPDLDGDSIPNTSDNCAATYNPDQKDTDRDHIGDACDFTSISPNSSNGAQKAAGHNPLIQTDPTTGQPTMNVHSGTSVMRGILEGGATWGCVICGVGLGPFQ